MTGEADAFNSGEPKKIKVCGWWFRPNDIIFLCDDNLSTLNPSSDISFPTESRKGWLKCDFSSSMDLIPNFNSETIHKKCFVSGEIRLDYPPEKKDANILLLHLLLQICFMRNECKVGGIK